MSARHWLCLGCALTLMSGCSVGPDYKPPTKPAGAEAPLVSLDDKAETSVEPPDDWWQLYQDARLDALLREAFTANADLAAAQANLTAASALVAAAKAGRYPDTRIAAGGVRGRDAVTDEILELGGHEPQTVWLIDDVLEVSYEVDLFGRVRRSVEAAHAQTEAALESRNDALVSLEAEVAQTYMQLRGAQALRQITQSLVDQQDEIVRLTQSQAKVGLASELDVKSAAAQLAQTQAQLPQYDQQIEQALNGLSYLLGEPPGSLATELSAPAAVPPVPPAVPVGLPSTLARRRPDIRRAEASLHAATADVGVAVAQFYPDISLTGQVGTRATNASGLTHWSSLFYSFGPSISLPIFEGGSLVANLHLSQAQQQQAALEYRKTVLMALRDVDNALAVYRTDQARRAALGDSVAALQASFELARDSYRKGLVTFINVLDAERQLSDAQQQYTQGTTQVSTDLVALYKALGGGWQAGAADGGGAGGSATGAR